MCVTAEKNGDVTGSYVEEAVKETVASDNVSARGFEERIYFLMDLCVKYDVVTVYCSRALLNLKVSSSFLFFNTDALNTHVIIQALTF